MNFDHDLFIWNPESGEFVQATFIGFEMLSFYVVHDGYITNSLRGYDYFIHQTLVWSDNNELLKIDEEVHLFE